MNREQLINELKAQGVDVVALQNEISSSKAKIKEYEDKIRELNSLPAAKEVEIKALKDQLANLTAKVVEKEKEQAFDKLLEEKKVAPAQKEKVLATFSKAEEMVDFYKDSPAIVNGAPVGSGAEGTDDVLTEAELAMVKNGTYTKEEIIANRKIGPKKKK